MGNIIKNLNHTAEEINDILASVSTKAGESELVNVKNDLNSLSTYVHEEFAKKTTLAEYGIEDANISETTITLGENSIEVATSEGLSQAITDLTALIEEKADKSALAVVENATKAGTVTVRAGSAGCTVVVDSTNVHIPAYSSVVVRPQTRFYNNSWSFQESSFVGCDFRADTTGWTSMTDMFRNFGGLDINVSNMNTSQVTSMNGMFKNNKYLISLDLGGFDTSQVTSMQSMFSGCSSLTSLNVSSFNTAKVKNMNSMFSSCSALTSLGITNFDTVNVTNMKGMFSDCSALTSLNLQYLGTYNVENMSYMFNGCSSLTSLSLSSFNTLLVTDMSYMFSNCRSLASLNVSKFNTYSVTNMEAMFQGCESLTSLDVSNFNTANVTNMNAMFNGCSSLTSLNVSGLDTSKVITMMAMFSGLSKFTGTLDLRNFNMSKVTNLQNFVSGLNSSAKLNMEGCDTSNVTDLWFWNNLSCWQNLVGLDFGNINNSVGSYPGSNCPTIVGDYSVDDVRNNNLYTYRNLNSPMDWSNFPKLNVQSFLAIINGLKDLTGQDSLTLTLPTRIQSSLTDDDIAKATDKNWIIVWK